jgi:hypothetical protein
MIKCLGKGRVLYGIEKLRTVPKKMNVSPFPVLVVKPNLTCTVGQNIAIAQKWMQSWTFVIVVCMYFNIHCFAALICVHAVRQLATLLNKLKQMNCVSKWKLIILYCSCYKTDSVEVISTWPYFRLHFLWELMSVVNIIMDDWHLMLYSLLLSVSFFDFTVKSAIAINSHKIVSFCYLSSCDLWYVGTLQSVCSYLPIFQIFDKLTLEDGSDTLSLNVGDKWQFYNANVYDF